jgi:PAS domain-containing protein
MARVPASSSKAAWTGDDKLTAILSWIAASIALIVAIALPLGYFWLSYQGELKESAVAARLHAAFVMQAIGAATGEWQRSVEGLIETELSASDLPEQRSIVELSGRIVTSSGPAVEAPTLMQTVPVGTAKGPVGSVVVVRSVRPLLWRTLIVAIFAAALAAAIYLSLRLLPVRALRRALVELRRQESRSRELLEEELRVVLDNVIDGIIVFNESGEIASSNRAAARMLGYANGTLAGTPITDILRSLSVNEPANWVFPVGRPGCRIEPCFVTGFSRRSRDRDGPAAPSR